MHPLLTIRLVPTTLGIGSKFLRSISTTKMVQIKVSWWLSSLLYKSGKKAGAIALSFIKIWARKVLMAAALFGTDAHFSHRIGNGKFSIDRIKNSWT
jgi:hypothetical protein